jgi:thiamine-monophosphate kinase
MGAKPAWFTLSLTMPMVDELWLADFSRGLFDLAQQFNVQLIGGDTSRGPLSITIQAHGLSPKNKVLLRQGAQPGDFIYVTQTLGDAGLALLHCLEKIQLPQAVFSKVALRLNRPFPRVREGLLFRDQAHSMIDVSDGLASDLGHILHRSGVGAIIHAERLPLSDELTQSLTPLDAVNLALTAGDDYELCCTVAENKQDAFDALLQKEACIAHCIGQVTAGNTLRILYDGLPVSQDFLQGYSHF